MHLPGYTAAASLYDSNNYYVARGNTRTSAEMLSRITAAQNVLPTPPGLCGYAQDQCIQNAQGSGYDPSGWCNIYNACIVAGYTPPGTSGGGCPACIDNIERGCCCDESGNCCCKNKPVVY